MQYRRANVAGASYFFTVNLHNRNSKLLIEHIDELRFAFKKVRSLYYFKIDSIVILPDHLHMIMTLPENDANYSLRWNIIKSIFTRRIALFEPISQARKNKRERGIWQRRFWEHLIRDELDYIQHVNYIHYNPVKHGYVAKPSDWEYSSIHHFIKLGILTKDWASGDATFGIFGE